MTTATPSVPTADLVPLTPFQQALKPGEQAYWTDPDGDASSGIYTVVRIEEDDELPRDADSMVQLRNEAGSEAEAYLHELREVTELDSKILRITVTITAEYPANREPADWHIDNIRRNLRSAVNRVELLGEPTSYRFDFGSEVVAEDDEDAPARQQ